MAQGERRNRELGEGRIAMLCRECWVYLVLRPENVEVIDGAHAYRCHDCGRSFIIRDEDARTLLLSTGADPLRQV